MTRIPTEAMHETLEDALNNQNQTLNMLLRRAEDGFTELTELRLNVAQWLEFLHDRAIEQAAMLGEHDRAAGEGEADPSEVYARLNLDPDLDDGQFIEAYRREVVSDG